MNLKLSAIVFFCASILSCSSDTVGPVASSGNVPPNFFIDQNYPNPFKDTTVVRYGVPSTGGSTEFVSLLIFDKFYNPVRTLAFNNSHPFGTFTVTWDGRDTEYKKVPPGIYIIELYGSSPNTFISRITAVKSK